MKKEKANKGTKETGGYWLESLGLESAIFDTIVFHNQDGSSIGFYVDEGDELYNSINAAIEPEYEFSYYQII